MKTSSKPNNNSMFDTFIIYSFIYILKIINFISIRKIRY